MLPEVRLVLVLERDRNLERMARRGLVQASARADCRAGDAAGRRCSADKRPGRRGLKYKRVRDRPAPA